MRFSGTITALVTPFRADEEVDFDALSELIEWQIESRVDGLVPCGSTGESATLSHEEHNAVVRHTVSQVRGRVPVIAGTGSNATREAIALTREAKEAGADGALLISPYYNKPTQEGIFEHYRAVAQAVGLPMVIYNIPGRTASRIEPETAARLSRVPSISGIKEAGGDLALTSHMLELVAPGFSILSGDDVLTLPMLALGAHGVISTTSNLAPRQMGEITRAFRAGDLARAREAHFAIAPLMRALFVESNPIPLKAALHAAGRIRTPQVRLPLTPLGAARRPALEAAIAACKPE
jgi:4-hydroxy-tetrahydrodipicolinate synthase